MRLPFKSAFVIGADHVPTPNEMRVMLHMVARKAPNSELALPALPFRQRQSYCCQS